MSDDTYLTALKMLARRELSEAQLRQRLLRRQHDPDAIEAALARLKSERSLDDERVAGAIARSETNLKKRGRYRVTRQIEAAGIASSIAKRIVDETFAAIDGDALLAAGPRAQTAWPDAHRRRPRVPTPVPVSRRPGLRARPGHGVAATKSG